MDLARAWICIAQHVEQMRAAYSQSRGQTRRLYQQPARQVMPGA